MHPTAKLFSVLLFIGLNALGQCLNFPAGLVPLSSVAYVTAANSAGDHLVVGPLVNGLNTLSTIPLPSATNQLFCDASVQLAPQQFFPNVYVPTAAERGGTFSAFNGLLLDPANNQPFSGGVIPAGRLGAVYAFRIGAVQTADTSRNWSVTSPMSSARFSHVSVLLPNGKVLVLGNAIAGNFAELYDPATGTFTQIGKTLFPHGQGLTATLLNDGRVLIVGGGFNTPSFAELFDPGSGQFIATGNPATPHALHTATLLTDGRVLVAGGVNATGQATLPSIAAAEIYDPKTGKFTATGSMATGRNLFTATLLPDGRVLVTGGTGPPSLSSAELYDPATGKFAPTGGMQAARDNHFAVLLPNGRVLIGGGVGILTAPAEEYDPATGTFALRGSLDIDRQGATATLLPNGQVLVAGGFTGFLNDTNSAVLYIPSTGLFVPTGNLNFGRTFHRATLLPDGRVLVTGGISGAILTSAEVYTPITQGLVTSQTGLTFRAGQGAGALPSQTVAVLSPTDTIPYNVTVKTFSGRAWLKATPANGTSGPNSTTVNLSIAADATGLAAQDYYGAVTLTPTDGKHPPVSIAIVLTIVPAGAVAAPGVAPTGLVFTAPTGTSPKAQTFTISNVTSKALTFTAAATQTTSFFDFNPKAGSINAGQSQTITVAPSSASLASGVYRSAIKVTFGDGSSQSVDVLLVVSATAGASTFRGAAAACIPTKLLPVLTSLGAGFSTPLAWPTPIIVQVVDDCGTASNSGTVTSSFTDGDSPLSLIAIGNGVWSATWVPVHNAAGASVRADAQAAALSGTVQVSGQVAANPKVPLVAVGGVLSSGDYMGSPAQGLLASIFGVALADGALGNSSLPLPPQLGSTSVIVSGVQLPLLYVSDGQVNVLMPYELAVNAPHQLIVQRGNAISVPVSISVFENQPSILAKSGNGGGQGHVYRIDASGAQILADAAAPAKAGDVLVIYTVGLGPVTPPLKSGDPAPLTFLEPITGTAALTIGGVPAVVQFAGLTPGYSGLYQVNAMVPPGVTPGSQVPVTVSVNGRAGAGSIFMAVQ